MLLVILTVIAVVLIGWYFFSHKLVSDAEELVIQKLAALDRAHRQREDLARQLLNSGSTDQDLENDWLHAMETNVNPEQVDAHTIRAYAQQQLILDHALKATIAKRKPQAPAVSDSWEVSKLYQDINHQIQTAVSEYNRTVIAYNERINQFPINLLPFSEKTPYPKLKPADIE